MQTDHARVTLRSRGALEAVDLGYRMARECWRPLVASWLVFVVPVGVVVARDLEKAVDQLEAHLHEVKDRLQLLVG